MMSKPIDGNDEPRDAASGVCAANVYRSAICVQVTADVSDAMRIEIAAFSSQTGSREECSMRA